MKEVMMIINAYRAYGVVSDIQYRGKMRFFDAANEDDLVEKIAKEKDPYKFCDWRWIPAWSFILTHKDDGKRYRFVVAKDDVGAGWRVFPGKSFCYGTTTWYYQLVNGKFILEDVESNINIAIDHNHFTPHPTCKVIREVKA